MTPVNPCLGRNVQKNGPLFNCQSIYTCFGITSLELNMAPGVLLEPCMSQADHDVTETPIVSKGLKVFKVFIYNTVRNNINFVTIEVFLNPFAKVCRKHLVMELLICRLIRVLLISIRYFCLINNVLCNFVWFTKKYQMYINCIHLFMSLFIIPSQSIIGKILPNL